ncbi:GGDEF domain-containing protein [Pseudothauera rhizosphaerae]|uniref:GGDEF domain-containing protein n=1 Tax=Pseudothauera rhizosphaerae TaxID=2565932 RepID=UPI001454C13B|nr:diguanylate cyclase [Pseudothauera rhizosphaerae]
MNDEHRIDAALFRHLVDRSAIPLVGSGAASLLVGASLAGTAHQTLAFAWVAAVFLVIAIRVWLVRRCQARIARDGYRAAEAHRFAATTGLSGLIWGCAGLGVLNNASPESLVVIITSIQAMTMGGALTLAAFPVAFYAFSLPAMVPLIGALALKGDTTGTVLAIFSSIMFVLIARVAKEFNGSLRNAWQMTFERTDLLEALQQSHDRQANLANTDGLTGIANRRRFDDLLEREAVRLQRTGEPLSLLLMDVDHFKAYNDTYGHLAGDECLKRVAEVFQAMLSRRSDLAARYGGEEFAAILTETDHRGALQVAEQIRTGVEALGIAHRSAATAPHVTVSLGVVTLDGREPKTPAQAIALADRELYRAKREGRNRIAAWSGSGDIAETA